MAAPTMEQLAARLDLLEQNVNGLVDSVIAMHALDTQTRSEANRLQAEMMALLTTAISKVETATSKMEHLLSRRWAITSPDAPDRQH